MGKVFNLKDNKNIRRNLRKNMTDYEKIFWYKIRLESLGVRFRRQYGIGNYIVDFYCPEIKLVVEVDGGHHFEDKGIEYDKNREEYMVSVGLKTIRFSNKDVNENIGLLAQPMK